MSPSTAAGDPRARLLGWLARRDRSEREIRTRLAAWGTDPESIVAIVEEFSARGLIDDRALAEKVCDWHSRRDPMGPRRLRMRLEARGIPAEIATEAVQPLRDRERQRELAQRLLDKRLPASASLEPERRVRRLAAYLGRRGFDEAIVRELLLPLLAARGQEEKG